MTETWTLAALWLGLALVAGLASIWLRVATALSEIMLGIVAGAVLGTAVLGVDQEWIKFLAGAGAIILTFLAGAELDPGVFRRKWKEATAVGLVSFFAPLLDQRTTSTGRSAYCTTVSISHATSKAESKMTMPMVP